MVRGESPRIVNHVPEEKEDNGPSRSCEEGGPCQGSMAGRTMVVENKGGGPRRKILAINYCATSRYGKLLPVQNRQ